jgi:uncharacterized SAM-binding protein YcdF (DUF218 family)
MHDPTLRPAFTMFLLKNFIATLLLPPLFPLVMVAAGLLLLGRLPRSGRLLAWGGVLLGLLLSTPASVSVLLDGLETDPVVNASQLKDADAIVILGGGSRKYAPEYGGSTVNRLSLERVRYGARLARQSGLPVLVSGGSPARGEAEATLMKTTLEEDFHVPVRWSEEHSLDTRDNAENSAAMLIPAGIRRIVLVTHAAHMARAREAFERAGLQVTPAPTAFLLGRGASDDVLPELPNMNSAYAGWFATHEWIGLITYRLAALGRRFNP